MKAKKVMALALAAVMLMCATVATTVAYLTDSESVKNTFTVGQVGLFLDEAVVDVYGEPTNGRTSEGNAYKLIPGHTYTKDPTVYVKADSEKSYIRMVVTVNCLSELDAIFTPSGTDLMTIFKEYDSAKWLLHSVTKDVSDNTRTYEFRYAGIVDVSALTANEKVTIDESEYIKLTPLFTSFTVPSNITGAQLNTLNGLSITVEAHAIQADGFTTADLAWAEF